ncbi:MAG: sigma-54-dependent Fis family transcriptional regulator [Verrucomicrobia bacterium]|nr:sigma-54-dependent Fis family transcriptional regulator [Verrucomicrobiota bacterium]
MPNERILIVDDDLQVASSIKDMLDFEAYVADIAANLDETESFLKKRIYDAAIVDLRMPDASGLDVLAKLHEADPAIAVLMLTAFGRVEVAANAFKLGAKDFLTKPVSRAYLCAALKRALDASRIQREARELRHRLHGNASFVAIIGRSPKLREALDLALRAAPSDLPVLICGETGTGKELVAVAIHNASPRADRSMVATNLADNPEQLRESALFGHTKGAFTGALSSRRGFFQEAHKSTLFLDEFTEVSVQTQATLLRAIEHKKIRPVGSDQEVPLDVRIICATNRNVTEEIAAGKFRADLYHRIAGVIIELPPLRERREDIPLLAAHFVRGAVANLRAVPEIEPEALELLRQYDWPGNVRELKNVMERAVLLSGGGPIRREHCMLRPASGARLIHDDHYELPLKAAQDRFTTDYLRRLLARYSNDTQKVADHASVHVTTIRRMIRELGIQERILGGTEAQKPFG